MIIFYNVFTMTLIGSFTVILFLLFEQITKRVFNGSWHYHILKLLLLFFVIPVGKLGEILLEKKEVFQSFGQNDSERISSIRIVSDYWKVIMSDSISNGIICKSILLIWVSGAVLILIRQILCYLRFRFIIANDRKDADTKLYDIANNCKKQHRIRRPVKLYVNENINTPMLIGFFSPIILLPSNDIKPENAEFIITHELTHYKSKDLFFKIALLLIRTIHWFNPFIYMLTRKVEKWCEYACDERNAIELSHELKKKYGLAILDVAAIMPVYSSNFGTPFLLPKQNLKERLEFMLGVKKMKKVIMLLSLVFALTFLMSGIVIASSAELFNGMAYQRNQYVINATANNSLSIEAVRMD